MRCSRCGTDNSGGGAFCTGCGNALPAPAAAATSAAPATGAFARIVDVARFLQQEPTGLGGAALVFVVSAVVSLVGWVPLSAPGQIIGSFVPIQYDCASLRVGSPEMYLCSMKIAFLSMIGPLIVMVAAAVLVTLGRRAIMRALARLPAEFRPLGAPLIATVLFATLWAGIHHSTANQTGILPQTVFPAVAGLFTYVTSRFSAPIQRVLAPFFAWRDTLAMPLRVLGAVAAPGLVAFIITFQDRVSQEAMKEHIVVLITFVTGYLALAPRGGDVVSAVQSALPGRRLQGRR